MSLEVKWHTVKRQTNARNQMAVSGVKKGTKPSSPARLRFFLQANKLFDMLGVYSVESKVRLPDVLPWQYQNISTQKSLIRASCFPLESLHSMSISTANKCQPITVHMVTQSFPSPVLSCIESAPQGHVSRIVVDDSDNTFCKPSASKGLQAVHISAGLVEDFTELARENTEKDLETCGVLGAFLEEGTFYVTTLIIPKQESTSSSCQAMHEEEVFAIQNERSLFPVGWIHTHPSQSCFMSSIDLHTHYSYQVMVPEAFAIVLAPTDTSRSYGIFRLSDPGGMSILRDCHEEGFHPHKEPADGSPLYEHCSNVFKNLNLRFEIFDLR